jgi:hypothetical protein
VIAIVIEITTKKWFGFDSHYNVLENHYSESSESKYKSKGIDVSVEKSSLNH